MAQLHEWDWPPLYGRPLWNRVGDASMWASLLLFPPLAFFGWIVWVLRRKGPLGMTVLLGPVTLLGITYLDLYFQALHPWIERTLQFLSTAHGELPCVVVMALGAAAATLETWKRRRSALEFIWPALALCCTVLVWLQFVGWRQLAAALKL